MIDSWPFVTTWPLLSPCTSSRNALAISSSWLTVITRVNPLTYAVDPLRRVVFAAQDMTAAAHARFQPGVSLFGYNQPIALELAFVIAFAVVFFALAIRGLSRTE